MSTRQALLRQVADSLLDYDYDTWNFGDSVAFEGMLAASSALKDERWLQFARGWVRAWESIARPERRLDCTAPGASMVAVYAATGDSRVLKAACQLAGYLIARPTLESGLFATWENSPLVNPCGPRRLDAEGARRLADPPAGAFLDCLHFDPPFLVSIGLATSNEKWVEAGVDQALRYIEVLQQPNGLFHHFQLADGPATYGPGWGRGQGWAILGLTDVIRFLEAAGRTDLASLALLRMALSRLVSGMAALQRADGHWSIDVCDPSSGDEFSTAAFMAVGFRRARTLGIGDDSVSRAANRAEAAVLAGVDADGTLSTVSAAVMACTEPSHYSHVPRGFRVPWGQGPLALMLAEAPSE